MVASKSERIAAPFDAFWFTETGLHHVEMILRDMHRLANSSKGSRGPTANPPLPPPEFSPKPFEPVIGRYRPSSPGNDGKSGFLGNRCSASYGQHIPFKASNPSLSAIPQSSLGQSFRSAAISRSAVMRIPTTYPAKRKNPPRL
jgi:hypothetical protein